MLNFRAGGVVGGETGASPYDGAGTREHGECAWPAARSVVMAAGIEAQIPGVVAVREIRGEV